MIIECINCSKKFEVNSDLIPEEGRKIQCGSCDHIWFYKPKKISEKISAQITPIEKTIISKEINNNKIIQTNKKKSKEKKIDKTKNYELTKYKKKSNFSFGKFLSYIIVFIISFIALIIVVDTFKTPLYSSFPNLERKIFSFFETLIDMKLFVRDLLEL